MRHGPNEDRVWSCCVAHDRIGRYTCGSGKGNIAGVCDEAHLQPRAGCKQALPHPSSSGCKAGSQELDPYRSMAFVTTCNRDAPSRLMFEGASSGPDVR